MRKYEVITKENFIKKSHRVHNNKYDYSKVNYISPYEKVVIICPTHGEFLQTPYAHKEGNGCLGCRPRGVSSTSENFIKKAKEVHGELYDYSKVVYKCNSEKVVIICPTHGEFSQAPANHLRDHGCFKCGNILNKKLPLTTEEFIKKAKEVHGKTFDYSKVIYKSANEKVIIICPIHGEFLERPTVHLGRSGCNKWFNNHKCNGKKDN